MKNTSPPIIIAFVSPKGGVGKSTSCLSLASSMAHKGHKVQIIDFDQTETLWRWYSENDNASNIPNLRVEKGPPTEQLAAYIEDIWENRDGFVFIDLAGSLTKEALLLATFAHLTITPAKLNEPDIVEATKLSAQLSALGDKLGKPINHYILLNEVPNFLASHQAHTLDQLDASDLKRFKTLIRERTAFPEAWLTGTPCHFGDQSRPAIKKAVQEIDFLTEEFVSAINQEHEERAAA